MSKKICKKLKSGEKIRQAGKPKYRCRECDVLANKEKEVCKPKKIKRA
jgi:rRNA maturation endonuclease Nob1